MVVVTRSVGAVEERLVWPNTTQELTAVTTPGVSRRAWGCRGACGVRGSVYPKAREMKRPGRIEEPWRKLEGEAAELSQNEIGISPM